ncbi:unnamed protein product [Closterium sp. Yama58-4]|nr:unnamed protein product [Closterium sp. Yama58-4]
MPAFGDQTIALADGMAAEAAAGGSEINIGDEGKEPHDANESKAIKDESDLVEIKIVDDKARGVGDEKQNVAGGKKRKKKRLVGRKWAVLLVGMRGEAELLQCTKQAIMRRVSVPARDLRLNGPLLSSAAAILAPISLRVAALRVDPSARSALARSNAILGRLHSFSLSLAPSGYPVTGRKGCMMVNLEHVKAIVSLSLSPSLAPSGYPVTGREGCMMVNLEHVKAIVSLSLSPSLAPSGYPVTGREGCMMVNLEHVKAIVSLSLSPSLAPSGYPVTGREGCMMVNLEHVKAIVSAQQVLLFNPSSPPVAAFAAHLERVLAMGPEPILEEVVSRRLEGECRELERDAYAALNALARAVSTAGLEAVRGVKNRLTVLTSRVQKVSEVRVKVSQKVGQKGRRASKVLELILEEVVSQRLDWECCELEKDAYAALNALARAVSTAGVEAVRGVKNRLTVLTSRVQKVSDVLARDRDMASLPHTVSTSFPPDLCSLTLSSLIPPARASIQVRDGLEHLLDDDRDMADLSTSHSAAPSLTCHSPALSLLLLPVCSPSLPALPSALQVRDDLEHLLDYDRDMADLYLTLCCSLPCLSSLPSPLFPPALFISMQVRDELEHLLDDDRDMADLYLLLSCSLALPYVLFALHSGCPLALFLQVRDELEHLLDDDRDMADLYLLLSCSLALPYVLFTLHSGCPLALFLQVRDELEHLLDDDRDMADLSTSHASCPCAPSLSVSPCSYLCMQVRDELEHLLDDDRDMADLYLTRQLHVGGGEDVEELEMLLEAYFTQVDRLLNDLTALHEYVDDTEDYVNTQLDYRRNQLQGTQVLITATGTVLSMLIVIIAAFSMNLPNILFDSDGHFATVLLPLLGSGAALLGGFVYYTWYFQIIT